MPTLEENLPLLQRPPHAVELVAPNSVPYIPFAHSVHALSVEEPIVILLMTARVLLTGAHEYVVARHVVPALQSVD
jgi:hypothetical protein